MVEGDKWEMYIPSDLGYGDGGSGEKIKGGDVLIFRMEILNIKGGKKRLVKCDFKTKEGCDEDEVEAWTAWEGKPLADLEAEIAVLQAKSKEPQKKNSGVREEVMTKMKLLKAILKGRKKAEKAEL